MFRKAVLSLTFWYLAIVMGLSLGFSFSLYQVFSHQLTENEHRQEDVVGRIPFFALGAGDPSTVVSQLQSQLSDEMGNLRLNLLYFNLLILAGGGAISYFLAKRTLQPIQEAAESQSRFTGDASHELRTPLTAIRTELEVALRDERLSLKESKDLHKSTLEEVAKLEALASALLRLAQHDQEKSRSAFAACQIDEVLEEAIAKVQPAAKAKRISIVSEGVGGTVSGDFWSLTELFATLLDNAVKYSPEGTAVTVERRHEHDRKLAISVRDQGVGISAQDIPHIFDRFYQADTARTKDSSSGFGLGLSIAKKIADLHQGVIEVRSIPGKGSTFTVILPVRRA